MNKRDVAAQLPVQCFGSFRLHLHIGSLIPCVWHVLSSGSWRIIFPISKLCVNFIMVINTWNFTCHSPFQSIRKFCPDQGQNSPDFYQKRFCSNPYFYHWFLQTWWILPILNCAASCRHQLTQRNQRSSRQPPVGWSFRLIVLLSAFDSVDFGVMTCIWTNGNLYFFY